VTAAALSRLFSLFLVYFYPLPIPTFIDRDTDALKLLLPTYCRRFSWQTLRPCILSIHIFTYSSFQPDNVDNVTL
jgi:hypothetical protein